MARMTEAPSEAVDLAPSATPTAAAPAADSGRGRAWARDALRRRMLAGADALALVAASLAFGVTSGAGVQLAAFLALAVAIALVTAKLGGLYDRDHRLLYHSTVDELAGILTWSALTSAALVLLVQMSGTTVPGAASLVGLMAALAVLDLGLRVAARHLWRQVSPPERIVVVGSGALEAAVRRKFELFGAMHVQLVAALDYRAQPDGGPGPNAERLVARLGVPPGSIDRLLIAAPKVDERLIAVLVPFCRTHEIKLGLVPPARGMFGTAVQLDHVAELPILQYNTWDVSRSTLLAKRAVDVLLSAALLVLLLPLLPFVAAAIKLDTRGPVFFRQRRAGQHGRPFQMVKLRTMAADAESRLTEILRLDELAEPVFKIPQDPRVTSIGRWLRRTSIDELPQLWNVLRGDMSLVGPRPEQLELTERYSSEARRVRLAVKPGLTGPMQVFGRGALSFEERLAVERDYVENLSLGRDVRIIGMTLSAVIRGGGAF